MKDSTCIYHDPSYLYPYSNSKSENADIIFLRKYHDVITYGHIYILKPLEQSITMGEKQAVYDRPNLGWTMM